MPRIRSIKPDFTQNEKLSALSAETHLLALGLLCYADDEGYFNANPRLVQAAVFPLRDLSGTIPEMLRSLLEVGYIETSTGSDGKNYGLIVKFVEHQRVSHKVESKIKPLWNPPEIFGRSPESLRPELKGNRIEVELKGEEIPEPPPEGLHANQYACSILQDIGFPEVRGNIAAIAGAIECEVKRGKGKVAAYEFVLACTKDAMDEGCEINTFFFNDAKYRPENRRNGNGAKRQASAVEHRVSGNREVIADLARAVSAERVGPDSDELKNGSGTPPRKRVSARVG